MTNLNRFMRAMAITLGVLAIIFSCVLLTRDAGMGSLQASAHSAISALALSLVGIAFLILQPLMRQRPKEVLKNVLLGAAFVLWGIVQLRPQNALSVKLGGLVVALYVMDLAWTVLVSARTAKKSTSPQPCPANRCSSQKTWSSPLNCCCQCSGNNL